MILAAIDIGSNAARLLISEASEYKNRTVDFTKLNLLRIPLRLGMDVFDQGYIGEERKHNLIETMKAYRLLTGIYKVEAMKACATSAMRDAKNGQETIEEVFKQTGIRIDIISGQEEASIIYETHIAEMMDFNKSYLYIDVGGGSTELTLFSRNTTVFNESFNIGTIRLLQNQVSEEQWEQMRAFLRQNIPGFAPVEVIGSGGNINKVFSISKKKEGKPLSLETLKGFYKEMSSATLAERKHRYGFREDRADVIVPALQIYITIMRWINASDIYVPKVGLADGIVRMLYNKRRSG